MVKEIQISKKILMCVGVRKGFGLGFSVDKYMLNIDFGNFMVGVGVVKE